MNDLYALQKSVGARNIKPILRGFPDSSVGKEFACNAGDRCLILGLGRSAEEGIGYPLQYSDLENSINYTVHEVTKSQTQLSYFKFTYPLLLCCSLRPGWPYIPSAWNNSRLCLLSQHSYH